MLFPDCRHRAVIFPSECSPTTTSRKWSTRRTNGSATGPASSAAISPRTGQTTADLAEQGPARDCVGGAGVTPADIDFIVVGTTTPDVVFPNVGCLVQERLGIHGCPAFSVEAACSGFIYALTIADRFMRRGQSHAARWSIGAETLSRITTGRTARHACSSAMARARSCSSRRRAGHRLLSPRRRWRLQGLAVFSLRRVARQRSDRAASGRFIQMKGNEVFKVAVKTLEGMVEAALKANQIERPAIDWLIPHQANLRIIQATAKRLSLPMDRVILTLRIMAIRRQPPYRWRSTSPFATAESSAAICCCSKRSAAASRGAHAWSDTESMTPVPVHGLVLRPGRYALCLPCGAACRQPARADTFLLEPGCDLVGAIGTVRSGYEDTLTDIARRAGLGYEEIVRANPGVDPWLPGK